MSLSFTSDYMMALVFGFFSPECKIENCESCFSRNFCTKCKEGLYLHKGRCYVTCPEGYAAANGTMECSSPGKRPRVQPCTRCVWSWVVLQGGLGDEPNPSSYPC